MKIRMGFRVLGLLAQLVEQRIFNPQQEAYLFSIVSAPKERSQQAAPYANRMTLSAHGVPLERQQKFRLCASPKATQRCAGPPRDLRRFKDPWVAQVSTSF